MANLRLEGRVAVITGGASGLGRATARRFAEEGADVVLADLNPERGAEAKREIEASFNRRAVFVQCDVGREEDIDALVRRAVDEFGHIDCLLAAAGVSNAQYVSGEVRNPLADPTANHLINKSVADWERVLKINLTGVMLTDRAVARHMIAKGIKGSIINIASIAARVALPGAADYNVSKAGVEMLTQVLAMELVEHGIRVNAIGPGFIETPMTQGFRDDPLGRQRIMELTPMGRLGQPIEIANTALFLASDESSYFTGQTLFPGGGMRV
jgi:NAD(P)-dependent dehydrogenase (short-subunit alcohol dehydrogenase family)